MLHQSKTYCQPCNSVSSSQPCPLPKHWPWAADMLCTSGCAGAVSNKAQWFCTKVYKSRSFSICLFCGAALVWQTELTVVFFLFSGCPLRTASFPGLLSHLLYFQELPSSSLGLQLMEALVCFCPNLLLAGWGDTVNFLVWGIPLMPKCRLKMRKSLEALG